MAVRSERRARRMVTLLALGLVIAPSTGCRTEVARDHRPRDPHANQQPLQIEYRDAASVFVLRGGSLHAALRLPLWLDVRELDEDSDGKCSLFAEGFAVSLPEDQIYIHQQTCGELACRVLDVASGRLDEPVGGCMHAFGTVAAIDATGAEGWVVVAGSAEGVGEVIIAQYASRTGQRDHLSFGVSPYADVRYELAPSGLLLHTPCALPVGCEFRSYEGQPERTYRWTVQDGLTRLD